MNRFIRHYAKRIPLSDAAEAFNMQLLLSMKIQFTFDEPFKGRHLWRFLIAMTVLALWLNAFFRQVFEPETFLSGMLRHEFPIWLGYTLAVLLLLAEATAIALLVRPKTRHWGFLLSAGMLFTFVVYIAAALFPGWVSLDCGCSKFNPGWSWMTHFWFNLGYLVLTLAALLSPLRSRTRGSGAQGAAVEGLSAKRQIHSNSLNTLNS